MAAGRTPTISWPAVPIRTERPTASAALPKCRCAKPGLTRAERRASSRPRRRPAAGVMAKDAEEVRMDPGSDDQLGLVSHLHAHVAALVVGDGLEGPAPGGDIHEIAPREVGAHGAAVRPAVLYGHQAVRIRVGEGLQDDTVDDAEYRRVGADAHGQDQDHRGRETRSASERPHGQGQVAPRLFQGQERAGVPLRLLRLLHPAEGRAVPRAGPPRRPSRGGGSRPPGGPGGRPPRGRGRPPRARDEGTCAAEAPTAEAQTCRSSSPLRTRSRGASRRGRPDAASVRSARARRAPPPA